jgi:hypothetical protein
MLSYYIGCRIPGSKERREDELSSDYELQRQYRYCSMKTVLEQIRKSTISFSIK